MYHSVLFQYNLIVHKEDKLEITLNQQFKTFIHNK